MTTKTDDQNSALPVVQRVAAHFVARAGAQQMKGKARDRAALEFVTGAAALAAAEHGEKSAQWNELSMFAWMVSMRGFQWVETMAKGAA